MTLLRREAPELLGEVLVTSIQMRVLRHLGARRNLTAPSNPGLAVRTMAILAG